MNWMNFDIESGGSYPLTTDRMAEMQHDIQTAQDAMSRMMPMEECIVAGCEKAGDTGYVVMCVQQGTDSVRWEMLEVEGGSESALYLKEVSRTVEVETSEGARIVVRTEHVLEWTDEVPQGASYLVYADLPRLWLKKGAQDGEWAACHRGQGWSTPTDGVSMRVQHEGGWVHLWGSVLFGLSLTMGGGSGASGGGSDEVETPRLAVMTDPVGVPTGYKPKGDVLIPIRYNGAVSAAILAKNGILKLSQSPAYGDVIKIDTYYDL